MATTFFKYMNSKGRDYFLHTQEIELKNGKKQKIFYFARKPKEGLQSPLPAGYKVKEGKNGLPLVARI